MEVSCPVRRAGSPSLRNLRSHLPYEILIKICVHMRNEPACLGGISLDFAGSPPN